MSNSQGIIYIATGRKHIERALRSAVSVRQQAPGLSITLFCDGDTQSKAVDHLIQIEKSQYANVETSFLDKVINISSINYDRAIFLDADTFVLADICELFSLLERFDVAAAHDTFRTHVKDYHVVADRIERIPSSFPLYNTGVIAFRNTPAVRLFFNNWLALHKRNLEAVAEAGFNYCNDQTAFREALYHSDLRLATLPPEYNCRFVHPVFVNGQVKILHGPTAQSLDLHAEINKISGNRVFIPQMGTIGEKNLPFTLKRWYLKSLGSSLLLRLKRSLKRSRPFLGCL